MVKDLVINDPAARPGAGAVLTGYLADGSRLECFVFSPLQAIKAAVFHFVFLPHLKILSHSAGKNPHIW